MMRMVSNIVDEWRKHIKRVPLTMKTNRKERETALENAQTNIYLSQIRHCFTNNYWDHFVHTQ